MAAEGGAGISQQRVASDESGWSPVGWAVPAGGLAPPGHREKPQAHGGLGTNPAPPRRLGAGAEQEDAVNPRLPEIRGFAAIHPKTLQPGRSLHGEERGGAEGCPECPVRCPSPVPIPGPRAHTELLLPRPRPAAGGDPAQPPPPPPVSLSLSLSPPLPPHQAGAAAFLHFLCPIYDMIIKASSSTVTAKLKHYY